MGHLVNYLFRRTFYKSQPCQKCNYVLNSIYIYLVTFLCHLESFVLLFGTLPPLGLAPKGNAFGFLSFVLKAKDCIANRLQRKVQD